MAGPLEGVVMADFTQLAQGPVATQILGDLGAEIIKIEPPKGDWMRHFSCVKFILQAKVSRFSRLIVTSAALPLISKQAQAWKWSNGWLPKRMS